MKLLIQRVKQAQVDVDATVVSSIRTGMLVFIGIEKKDTTETIQRAVERLLHYRIFSDQAGKMNLNVTDVDGNILVVSQFTLAADTQKGLRPSFSCAMPPTAAKQCYDTFVNVLTNYHTKTTSGVFGADMQVTLTNDGPVTFLLDIN